MAAGRSPAASLTITSLIFIIIFFLFPIFCQLAFAKGSQRSLLALAENQKQRLQKSNKTNQIRNCSEIINQSDCKSKPKCRWCRSNVLDDMCASKLEAWRLPSQDLRSPEFLIWSLLRPKLSALNKNSQGILDASIQLPDFQECCEFWTDKMKMIRNRDV
ncbi:hypothetical protein Cgig2_029384 [Carnegiea gigantea]|uniref:Uncharacterized protein n=1 Tax=Carnegiea gigantea TaxID=171969 RepID=A0A9Q1KV34_9CARY|nr:hypothetical protein Cgig2_029384 [Carnegiea gigantea]